MSTYDVEVVAAASVAEVDQSCDDAFHLMQHERLAAEYPCRTVNCLVVVAYVEQLVAAAKIQVQQNVLAAYSGPLAECLGGKVL